MIGRGPCATAMRAEITPVARLLGGDPTLFWTGGRGSPSRRSRSTACGRSRKVRARPAGAWCVEADPGQRLTTRRGEWRPSTPPCVSPRRGEKARKEGAPSAMLIWPLTLTLPP